MLAVSTKENALNVEMGANKNLALQDTEPEDVQMEEQRNVSFSAKEINDTVAKLVRKFTEEEIGFKEELKTLTPSERLSARVRKEKELAKLRQQERDALNPKENNWQPHLVVIPSSKTTVEEEITQKKMKLQRLLSSDRIAANTQLKKQAIQK